MSDSYDKAVALISARFSELVSALREIDYPDDESLILQSSIYYYLRAIYLRDEEWGGLTDEDRAYIQRSAGKIRADMINLGETEMRDLLRYVYQNLDNTKATEKTS